MLLQEEEEVEVGQAADKQSKGSSDGDATTGSYSSLEDDEAEIDHLAALAAKYQIDNVNLGNGNKICQFPFDIKLSLNNIKFLYRCHRLEERPEFAIFEHRAHKQRYNIAAAVWY